MTETLARALILDGNALARTLRERLRGEASAIHPPPGLRVLLVGEIRVAVVRDVEDADRARGRHPRRDPRGCPQTSLPSGSWPRLPARTPIPTSTGS